MVRHSRPVGFPSAFKGSCLAVNERVASPVLSQVEQAYHNGSDRSKGAIAARPPIAPSAWVRAGHGTVTVTWLEGALSLPDVSTLVT